MARLRPGRAFVEADTPRGPHRFHWNVGNASQSAIEIAHPDKLGQTPATAPAYWVSTAQVATLVASPHIPLESLLFLSGPAPAAERPSALATALSDIATASSALAHGNRRNTVVVCLAEPDPAATAARVDAYSLLGLPVCVDVLALDISRQSPAAAAGLRAGATVVRCRRAGDVYAAWAAGELAEASPARYPVILL